MSNKTENTYVCEHCANIFTVLINTKSIKPVICTECKKTVVDSMHYTDIPFYDFKDVNKEVAMRKFLNHQYNIRTNELLENIYKNEKNIKTVSELIAKNENMHTTIYNKINFLEKKKEMFKDELNALKKQAINLNAQLSTYNRELTIANNNLKNLNLDLTHINIQYNKI